MNRAPNEPGARPVGASILALFSALVALLGLFAAGSYFLIGTSGSNHPDWFLTAMGMLVIAIAYLVLAWMLWFEKQSLRWFAPVLLLALAVYASMNTLQDEVLDLASVLLFFLAAVANMAVIAWLRLQARRA